MTSRRAVRTLIAVPVLVCGVLGGQALTAPAMAAAPAHPVQKSGSQKAGPQEAGQHAAAQRRAAAKVLTYDAKGSAEFAKAVDKGVAIWNKSVKNVQLKPADSGKRANVKVIADNGWPRTQSPTLGNGTIYFGRQAVNDGYNTTRIASHEFGHILGLPDMKPGPCSSLMSGASAGPECTNPNPDAKEKSEVEGNFG
ncbi:snapalysin family zinc-dependent metalloprotease [Streptomyces sp. ODS28]|uniref:snapalysin family zinc-dependent metalloprotease n=1 Tax=Streptomyces sp. ODS28 TaxID=3136688 RepID=UPI0031EF4B27